VEFVPIQTSGAWHPSVTAYEVIDSASRAKLGRLLADPQDRPDKYSRGAVWHLQRADASQTPMAALVLALPAEGGLTLDDLAGVLHCFADAMKVILGRSRYVAPANDAIDITTAVGLMFEEWAYDPTVLALYREVCKSCERIPDSLLAEAKARRPWASGRSMARQVLYAQYDLALHGERLEGAQALWDGLARDAVLGGATGETIPARFEHPVDFPAGYYSYLWNAMVAADLNTAFRGKQLSAEVGRRLRDLVLSDGEQIPPGGAFAKFLGRAPNSKAFLALQTP
jgi:thimet oligopeptidase